MHASIEHECRSLVSDTVGTKISVSVRTPRGSAVSALGNYKQDSNSIFRGRPNSRARLSYMESDAALASADELRSIYDSKITKGGATIQVPEINRRASPYQSEGHSTLVPIIWKPGKKLWFQERKLEDCVAFNAE